ncbi:MAG TPA: hypothetical protein IGS53_11505 [Leptolyngbyaceae cyanobacterium M33_DOE_097]|uniref:4Fe-4S binding protein n=1 Tax=Oscillatoriales cyanobacterium SpSt-418 TaxID=2282169 RepID=A0A7C3KHD9_9CYAN|nr:hypothetical protein [Leptolyngbyaceae cyanobacterium M33_DOE_097]
MLNRVSEKTMHRIRWILVLGWLVLIASLFYDPITPLWTQPDNLASPFRVDLNKCIKVRETCLSQTPFSMSALIWWAMIVPAGIFILMTFGHEFWRRICPLSFLSQVPRALGIQRRRRVTDAVTGETRYELVAIAEDSWLGRYHLYLQFGFFVLGLGIRILYINSDRLFLGGFLIATIFCAILVGYLYAGKSWCHYFCPMSPVQLVYTGPRSLLGSKNYQEQSPTPQSMCRMVDSNTGEERSACVGCRAVCVDIDAEKNYWAELNKPGRRLVQYGYLGMVIAFYLYYFLYSGNWDYYFTGTWTHEADQVANVLDTGFYIYGRAIPIPKAIAVYITFGVLVAITFSLGLIAEKLCRKYVRWQGRPVSAEQAQHLVFTVFTLTSFWTFFSYGARPSLNRLPLYPLLGFNAAIVLVGSVWFYRTLRRTRADYERENVAISLRKQLQTLPIDPELLEGRNLNELSPNEIYILTKVLRGVSQKIRIQAYTGILLDLLQQQAIDVPGSFEFCRRLRQDLQLQDQDHFTTLEAIAASHPELLLPTRNRPVPGHIHDAVTQAVTLVRSSRKSVSR